MTSLTDLQTRIDALPRVQLGHFPTPLDHCPNLSARLGNVDFYIKRDDCTGVAFGGNKSRQHEFILADALEQGYDVFIQGAGSQSNHSRQLASAGAKLGVEVHIISKQDHRSLPVQGNHLVTHLMRPHLHLVPADTSMVQAKDDLADKLRAEGKKPYLLGMGAQRSLVLSAVAYVNCFLEVVAELQSRNKPVPDYIFTTSQGGTQAGLQLAAMALGLSTRVIGINPMTASEEAHVDDAGIASFLRGAAEYLDLTIPADFDIINDESYVGPGYAQVAPAEVRAQRLLAQTEGILVDPVYSGKGFAGAVDYIERGVVPDGSTVVFIHTGGLPAVFSYSDEII